MTTVPAARPAPADRTPGIGFTPFETRSDVILESALRAERLGFSAVSVAEAMTLSAPVVLTQLVLATERMEVTSGVLSVWSRTPATLALTAAHLYRLSKGRFVLGLGASTAPLTEGFHGLQWQAPLAKLRDVLTSVRALLSGERLPNPASGARALRLMVPPAPVPIGLAAISPASVRLAGGYADRWYPFLWPVNRLDEGRDLLDEGALAVERAGRTSVTACVPVAVGRDEAAAATVAARWLVTYATQMGPVYPRVLREFGYAAELKALLEANSDPRRPVLPAAAERLAHDVLLFAPEQDARDALRRWVAASDDVSLVLPFGVEPGQLDATLDALAPPGVRSGTTAR